MTQDEQVVIDVLEHNAQQWDATDPNQAQTFRDAIALLTRAANGQVVEARTRQPDALYPEPTPAPAALSLDPADGPIPPHTPGAVHHG
jgi:hypothetical protein